MSIRKTWLFISAVFMQQAVCSANIQPDTVKINATLEQLARTYKIPDYSVVIVSKDRIVYQKDRQQSNAGKNYLIGSCSKSFTALAALKLANDGKISLDSPIKQYLPWFEMKNPVYTNLVTVRHLLNQTSGFERQYGFFDDRSNDHNTYSKQLADYIRNIPVRFSPGSTFLYSNLNYVLLGEIINQTSGSSYDAYLSAEILPAIGTKNTLLTQAKAVQNNLIQPYHYMFWGIPVRSEIYYVSDHLVPAGYISSNSQDLAAYLQFMLNKTVSVAGDTILPETLYQRLTGLEKVGYAMGWFHSDGDSISMVSHSGLDENFSSSITFFPEKGLGYAILCNTNSLEFCGLADAALRGIIFDKPFMLKGNMEKTLRTSAFFIPVVLLLGFIFNVLRWRKYGYKMALIVKVLPVMRLIMGIVLSIIPLMLLSKIFALRVKDMIRFSPDIAWGLILIMLIGIVGSTIHYFGTAARLKTIQ